MPALLALIFDVDGTLADTEEAHRVAFNDTFRKYGLPWEWSRDLYGDLLAVAGGKERMLHYIETYVPRDQVARLPGNLTEFIAQMHADKTRCYQSMLHNGKVPLRPGVVRLIKEAHDAGLKLGIATTTSMTNVEALFSGEVEHGFAPGAVDWFDSIAAGEMVTEKKPSPQVYQVALEGLGLAPENCIAFEDSVIGLQAATGAGLKTIITADSYSRRRQFKNPLIVLDQLGEPDQPFEVLQGDACGYTYADLEMVKTLHAKAD